MMTQQHPLNSLPEQADADETGQRLVTTSSKYDGSSRKTTVLHQSLDLEEGPQGPEFNFVGRRRKMLPWLLIPFFLVAALLIALDAANMVLVQQMKHQLMHLQQQPQTSLPPAATDHQKAGQMASLILDTRAAPNCTGNHPRLQPCWTHHQQRSNAGSASTAEEPSHPIYWTAWKLGRLQFTRDHVESSVYSLAPDGTGLQVHRGGTYLFDAQFRVESNSEVLGLQGGVSVDGSFKFVCSDQARFLGETLTCKVNTPVRLRPGDTVSMGIVSELHAPVQLFITDFGSYIRIAYLG